jgi:hypothetical protein
MVKISLKNQNNKYLRIEEVDSDGLYILSVQVNQDIYFPTVTVRIVIQKWAAPLVNRHACVHWW